MKQVKTSELIPGMITAEDVYTYNNQLVLPKGLILNDRSINKLAYYAVLHVKVEDGSKAMPEDISYESSYAERLQRSPEFIQFRKDFEEDVNNFKSAINDVVTKGAPLDVDTLVDHTLQILNLGTSANVFDMLHNMREYDDATYAHSMNVALICNVFARWLRLSEEQIRKATICGLLHDIGKTQIPDSIIKKPGKLTDDEYDLVKTHPEEGLHILQNLPLDPEVLDAVLMHHERSDGTGYPAGLKGDQIGYYARMVAIADVYDSLTSPRVYRGPLCPFKAIAIFESEGLQKYDPKFILIFLENVVNTYLLNDVRLNNGIIGKVVYIHREKLSSPTIQTEHGFLDLSIHPDLTIEALV